jgi:formylglycine-generating enzyme required for sulfatase activity
VVPAPDRAGRAVDHRLRALEQQVRALPSDAAPRARLRAELFRLAPLDDREAWSRAPAAAQDLVLAAVGRLLGPDYEPCGAADHERGGERLRVGAFRHVASGLVLQLVPGGSTLLGSLRGLEAERPRHLARLDPFLIGRFPVLQGEWDQVGGEDARTWERADLPIEQVTWFEAQRWLERAGGGLRLPTEAEWEHACRAGTQTEFFWGDEVDPAFCWFGEGTGWTTHPPAEHAQRANAFGLVDVAGNVFEWVEDAFAPYTDQPRDGGPRRRGGKLRVIRGGDAFNRATFCRSAYRGWAKPTDRGGGIGLRAARSLPF